MVGIRILVRVFMFETVLKLKNVLFLVFMLELLIVNVRNPRFVQVLFPIPIPITDTVLNANRLHILELVRNPYSLLFRFRGCLPVRVRVRILGVPVYRTPLQVLYISKIKKPCRYAKCFC